ncbi:hypothetical protein [Leptothoe spongobia]|uniref:hypothetical protein n=1 Tax=Leptothoe spongobia TaxID=2651728 RepID=UPI001C01955D|nr:hypothetical protein [Leptothoe spongobia]
MTTIVFFFLIFFPYITLIGNQKACQAQELDCPHLEQSALEERVSDLTTSWGNIPISTAEVVAFFPAGLACGFVTVTSQLQGLMRLRQAITRQVNNCDNPMDVTLIAPLLIDQKQSFVDQILGGIVLLFPALMVFYSINLIFVSLGALKEKLPYSQDIWFYRIVYFLSALLVLYGLLKTGVNIYRTRAIEDH